jgi:hypothetical protein
MVTVLPLEEPLARTSAFVMLALVAFAAHRLRSSVSWLVTGAFTGLVAAAFGVRALVERPIYQFTPFMTEPSASALVITIALIVLARFWFGLRAATRQAMGDRPERTYVESMRLLLRAAALAPWVWAFLWVLVELSMAFSPSTSTLLLVVYFAGAAVGCVAAGRARRSAWLRQAGLGLALGSAATAVYGAGTYFDFGARIAAYLVTSAFLLGIAYWYRRPGARATERVATAGEI